MKALFSPPLELGYEDKSVCDLLKVCHNKAVFCLSIDVFVMVYIWSCLGS